VRADKLTEFVTALVFALVIGAAVALTVRYLGPGPRAVGLIVIGAVAIAAWQYLRKKFGRAR